MKAVFIIYGQSLTQAVEQQLNKLQIRGFTRWAEVHGRGSDKGEPHYGTHAWPTNNGSILTIVDDEKAKALLETLNRLNQKAEHQGLKAFVWEAEQGI
jgi:nitrogen regulatory protein PII